MRIFVAEKLSVIANNQQIFEIILQKSTDNNIDLDTRNKNGLTPLDFVYHFDNKEMVETLEQKLSKKPNNGNIYHHMFSSVTLTRFKT